MNCCYKLREVIGIKDVFVHSQAARLETKFYR